MSTILFGLYHVSPSTLVQTTGASLFLTYEVLGAYLCFLYQRSGGSLPLVAITHTTLRLIGLGGGRMLPFTLWS